MTHDSQEILALFRHAVALHRQGRLQDAKAAYGEVLDKHPRFAAAYSNRGAVQQVLKQPQEALRDFEAALELDPVSADAHYNRGNVLKTLQRPAEALCSYERAIELKPQHLMALNNRATVLMELNRTDEALEGYSAVLALDPSYVYARINRGYLLQKLRRHDEALTDYGHAIKIDPTAVEANYNRGNVLREIGRLHEAIASYEAALACKPDHRWAQNNKAICLVELNRLTEAIVEFEKAMRISGPGDFMFGNYLHTKAKVFDWTDWNQQLQFLRQGLDRGEALSIPFPVLSLFDDPATQANAAKAHCATHYPKVQVPVKSTNTSGKIRVGYYSADFRAHPTAYLIAELLERHDRDQFEVFAFSFGPGSCDAIRERIVRGVDRFIDVAAMSDASAARLSRELGIDIAVDLMGYTSHNRAEMFAEGCAPIQVSFLGYIGTMGAPFIHYIIADKTVIPPHTQSHYTEKPVYLPYSFQANDTCRPVQRQNPSRRECGLPEAGFVFCCFNNNYKILPETFDSWMRILQSAEGSVLWLLKDNPTAAENLRRAAQSRGVDAARLVFAQRTSYQQYLARYRTADLFLDTYPYNAGATASDALWAGLPVLTQRGEAFAARMCASLVRAVGLPQMVCETRQAYEAKAIELAQQPAELLRLRSHLENGRPYHPLFRSEVFARHLEAAYSQMLARHKRGLPPDVIEVPPLLESTP